MSNLEEIAERATRKWLVTGATIRFEQSDSDDFAEIYATAMQKAFLACCTEACQSRDERIKKLWQLNVDACEDDTAIRNLVRSMLGDFKTDGDSYGVPTLVTITESLIASRDSVTICEAHQAAYQGKEWCPVCRIVDGTHDKIVADAAEIQRLKEALEPFSNAADEVTKIGSIAMKEQWLWKPSSNKRDTVGINAQHLLDARAALSEENKH